MSESQFSIVPRIVWQGMQPREVKVYCALASRVDWKTGVCYPSRATIANDLNVSVSTVDRALKRLISAGVIEVDKRKKDTGDHDSNLYRLPFAINSKIGGRSSEATWPQNWRLGGRKSDALTRTNEREGISSKNSPATCQHIPIDEEGYCTACGETLEVA